MASVIGQSIKRREDPRFIQGRGQYAGNVQLPGTLHMAVLRSPFAHARITRTDGGTARAMPGVVGVYFGADFEGLQYTGGYIAPNSGGKVPVRPVVAKDTVRFAGEAVAIVVAESRHIAEDALELIEVDYDPLDVAVSARAATEDGAPQLHEGIERNTGMVYRSIAGSDIEEAFRSAAAVARLSFVNNGLIPMTMEPRTVVARWDPGTGELTQWATSQMPHVHRTGIAGFFKLPEHKVRIISIDVGGGFGAKAPVYPEDVVACSLAMRLERPVKWVETRRENCATMTHGRDQITEIELAADAEGRLLGLRGTTWANAGAYLSGFGMGIPSVMHVPLLPGAYHLPAKSYTVHGVYTNTNPVDAYRSAGRQEATFAIELMMDTLAAELGMDPAEIRRRNFIQPDEFPAITITGMGYDSGDYEAALQKALDLVGYEDLREEQTRLREQGRYMGVGVSSYIECCGFGPSRILKNSPSRGWMLTSGMGGGGSWEAAHLRVSPQGKVWVGVGVTFTAANWDTAQTVDVNGADDNLDDSDISCTASRPAPRPVPTASTMAWTTSANDDAAPTVSFTSAGSAGSEATTPVQLGVTFSHPSTQTITVDYAATGWTAAGGGTDYTLAAGTVTFAPLDTSESIGAAIVDHGDDEPNETIVVTLSSPSNATLAAADEHTYTIQDENLPVLALPSVQFAAAMASGSEGHTPAKLKVTLSKAAAGTVTVKYAATGGGAANGADYTLAAGALTFAPGETSKEVSAAIANDPNVEADETFEVTLSVPSGATLGTTTTTTYTLLDNDSSRCAGTA